jgi:hypothetical protein
MLSFPDFCMKTANEMTQMTGGDLSKFEFVGIVERFQESLNRLGGLLGHQLKNVVRNKTTNKRKLTSEQIDIIRYYNQYDLTLYQEGLKRFEKGVS